MDVPLTDPSPNSCPLPDEIMAYIFLLVIASIQEDWQMKHHINRAAMALTLSHVCTSWRAIALGTARLWNTFHSTMHVALLGRFLARCEEKSQIALAFIGGDETEFPDRPSYFYMPHSSHLEGHFRALIAYELFGIETDGQPFHRVNAIHIGGPRHLYGLRDLLRSYGLSPDVISMPQVKSLDFNGGTTYPPSDPITLQLDRLLTLSVRNQPPRIRATSLSRLALTLEGRRSDLPSQRRILSFWNSFPSLIDFELKLNLHKVPTMYSLPGYTHDALRRLILRQHGSAPTLIKWIGQCHFPRLSEVGLDMDLPLLKELVKTVIKRWVRQVKVVGMVLAEGDRVEMENVVGSALPKDGPHPNFLMEVRADDRERKFNFYQ